MKTLFLMLAAATLTSSLAYSLPSKEVTRTYYSSRTFSQAVGEELVTSCYGVVRQLLWGKRTRYYKTQNFPCYNFKAQVECMAGLEKVECPKGDTEKALLEGPVDPSN